MNIPFLSPIYPYTPGTWVSLAFWWLNFASIIAAFIICKKCMK